MDNTKRLSFLYDAFPEIGGRFLDFWINDEEFQSEVISLMENHIPITEKTLLDVMTTIYQSRMEVLQAGGKIDFNYNWAKRAIKRLEARLNG